MLVPSVAVRSGLLRAANSSWPERLHTVHIITPPNTNKTLSVLVIYGRVKGVETWKRGGDRQEQDAEKGGEDRGESGAVGGNEVGDRWKHGRQHGRNMKTSANSQVRQVSS